MGPAPPKPDAATRLRLQLKAVQNEVAVKGYHAGSIVLADRAPMGEGLSYVLWTCRSQIPSSQTATMVPITASPLIVQPVT